MDQSRKVSVFKPISNPCSLDESITKLRVAERYFLLIFISNSNKAFLLGNSGDPDQTTHSVGSALFSCVAV